MVLTNEELEDIWDTKSGVFEKPILVKGFRDDNIFYTVEDNRSIYFFVSATPIDPKASYKNPKKKLSLYRIYAISAEKCRPSEKFNPSIGETEEMWEMTEMPIPVNCNVPFNALQKFVIDQTIKTMIE